MGTYWMYFALFWKKSFVILSILIFSFTDKLCSQINFGNNCDGASLVVPLLDTNFCNNSDWNLMFEDDFDGDSLDLSIWRNPSRVGSSEGEYSHYSTLDNVVLEDGIAKLFVKKERVYKKAISWKDSAEILSDGSPNLRWYNYTVANIRTYQTFRYGYFEASCKVPGGNGFWPAMWMYGAGAENNFDPNTVSNEIDVFEFWKNDTRNHNMNIHVGDEACLTDYDGPDFSKSFHTFTMIWEPYKIEWYVDGELKKTYPRFYQMGKYVGCRLNAWQTYEQAPFPVNPMLIYLSSGIESKNDYHPDASSMLPSALEIDWVRFYSREGLLNLVQDNTFTANIHPNPTSGNIQVDIYSATPLILTAHFYNSHGKLLFEKSLTSETTYIDLSNYENGIYLMRIFNSLNFQSSTHKVIINK